MLGRGPGRYGTVVGSIPFLLTGVYFDSAQVVGSIPFLLMGVYFDSAQS
jgi:hypothetical protein